MTREYVQNDGWLYKKVVIKRGGKEHEYVRLRNDISLSDRITALSEAFSVDGDKLFEVTQSIGLFILHPEDRDKIITKEKLSSSKTKTPFEVFMSEARKAGIPREHAHRLVIATAEHLSRAYSDNRREQWKMRSMFLLALNG
jgi:hypothetical protein